MGCLPVTAIVPARNEEERVGDTIRALLSSARVDRVVVVDDGSRDHTAAVAEAAGARVLRLARHLGKGGAVEAGLSEAETPYIAFVDADLGESAALLSQLAEPVVEGRADVAIADMPLPGGPRGFGIATRLARWAVSRYGNLAIDNPLCGQRVMTREAAESLRPLAAGFALEARATIMHGRRGHRVVVVPVDMTHRRTGRDLQGLTHRARQLWDIAREAGRWATGAGD